MGRKCDWNLIHYFFGQPFFVRSFSYNVYAHYELFRLRIGICIVPVQVYEEISKLLKGIETVTRVFARACVCVRARTHTHTKQEQNQKQQRGKTALDTGLCLPVSMD